MACPQKRWETLSQSYCTYIFCGDIFSESLLSCKEICSKKEYTSILSRYHPRYYYKYHTTDIELSLSDSIYLFRTCLTPLSSNSSYYESVCTVGGRYEIEISGFFSRRKDRFFDREYFLDMPDITIFYFYPDLFLDFLETNIGQKLIQFFF